MTEMPIEKKFKNYQIVHEIKKIFWSSPPDALFSRPEAAMLLGYSNEWLRKSKIPYIQMVQRRGMKCFYRKSDLEEWLKQFNAKPDAS